jgi:hypothetical protein
MESVHNFILSTVLPMHSTAREGDGVARLQLYTRGRKSMNSCISQHLEAFARIPMIINMTT